MESRIPSSVSIALCVIQLTNCAEQTGVLQKTTGVVKSGVSYGARAASYLWSRYGWGANQPPPPAPRPEPDDDDDDEVHEAVRKGFDIGPVLGDTPEESETGRPSEQLPQRVGLPEKLGDKEERREAPEEIPIEGFLDEEESDPEGPQARSGQESKPLGQPPLTHGQKINRVGPPQLFYGQQINPAGLHQPPYSQESNRVGPPQPPNGKESNRVGPPQPPYGQKSNPPVLPPPLHDQQSNPAGLPQPLYSQESNRVGPTPPFNGQKSNMPGLPPALHDQQSNPAGLLQPPYGQEINRVGPPQPPYGQESNRLGPPQPSYGQKSSPAGKRYQYGQKSDLFGPNNPPDQRGQAVKQTPFEFHEQNPPKGALGKQHSEPGDEDYLDDVDEKALEEEDQHRRHQGLNQAESQAHPKPSNPPPDNSQPPPPTQDLERPVTRWERQPQYQDSTGTGQSIPQPVYGRSNSQNFNFNSPITHPSPPAKLGFALGLPGTKPWSPVFPMRNRPPPSYFPGAGLNQPN